MKQAQAAFGGYQRTIVANGQERIYRAVVCIRRLKYPFFQYHDAIGESDPQPVEGIDV